MAEKGFNCILQVGGSTVGVARNVNPTIEADEQDTTTRDDGGWDNWQQGRKRLTADIEALYVADDAQIQAIEDAFDNDSGVSFQMTTDGGSGYSGTLGVLSLNPGPQDLDNAVMLNVSVKSRGTVTRLRTNS